MKNVHRHEPSAETLYWRMWLLHRKHPTSVVLPPSPPVVAPEDPTREVRSRLIRRAETRGDAQILALGQRMFRVIERDAEPVRRSQ